MRQETSSLLNNLAGIGYTQEDAYQAYWTRQRAQTSEERTGALAGMGNALAQAGKRPMIFTSYVTWRDSNFVSHGVMVDAISRRGARYKALMKAVRLGYTRPKWWQFWRWNEKNLWFKDCDDQYSVTFTSEVTQ